MLGRPTGETSPLVTVEPLGNCGTAGRNSVPASWWDRLSRAIRVIRRRTRRAID